MFDEIQWFFDLEKVSAAFNWPVSVEGLVNAKRQLDRLLANKGPAEDVMEAYKALSGAIGPTVMTALLQSDDAFPEVNHSDSPTPPSPGQVTLYVATNGKRVLAQCSNEWGATPKFSVG